MTLLLNEREMERLVDVKDMPEAIELMKQAYVEWHRNEASVHKRVTLQYPPRDGYYTGSAIRILSGMVPALDSAGVRIYPFAHDRPIHESGPRILDFEAGQELLLYYRYSRRLELASIMADYRLMNVRTSAPTGFATDVLARSNSRVLGVIGAGRHSPWQALAVCSIRPIEEVRIFSPTRERRERTAKVLDSWVGAEVRAVDSAEHAVREADVVTTVTNANKPVISGDWLSPGTHVNVVARGEIDERTVLRADHISCSWRDQILNDTPEFLPVSRLIREGGIAENRFHDLHELLDDSSEGRQSDEDITLFLSQGVGLWDAALATLVYDRAVRQGLGIRFDWEPAEKAPSNTE